MTSSTTSSTASKTRWTGSSSASELPAARSRTSGRPALPGSIEVGSHSPATNRRAVDGSDDLSRHRVVDFHERVALLDVAPTDRVPAHPRLTGDRTEKVTLLESVAFADAHEEFGPRWGRSAGALRRGRLRRRGRAVPRSSRVDVGLKGPAPGLRRDRPRNTSHAGASRRCPRL